MTIEALSAHFDVHKQRKGGGNIKLTYVAIDQMLNRANEVLGMSWNSELLHFSYEDGRCVIALSITVEHDDGSRTTRVGAGASTMKDPDDCIKSALAEALKKGLNQYGMGLYLWNEDEREAVEAAEFEKPKPKAKKKVKPKEPAETSSLQEKKDKLVAHWISAFPGESPTAAELQKYYAVTDFNDEAVVDGLLSTHNLD